MLFVLFKSYIYIYAFSKQFSSLYALYADLLLKKHFFLLSLLISSYYHYWKQLSF